MGWKSTIDITRDEAIRLIANRIMFVCTLSNKELENMIESLGYGDDTTLPYYGRNFIVVDNETS